METTQRSNGKKLVLSETTFESVARILSDLVKSSRARLCIFADMNGYPISSAGEEGKIDLSALTAVAAGTFSATAEMARMTSDEQRFQYIYHEGRSENIYLCNVSDDYLLIVLFDKSVALGLIRILTQRAFEKTRDLLQQLKTESEQVTRFLDVEFRNMLSDELDRSLGT